MSTILLFGPTGGVGQEILRQAADRSITVRAAERHWDDAPAPEMEYERHEANVLHDDLSPLMKGCDAVVSAIGLPRGPQSLAEPPPLYTEGAVRMVQGMRKAGVKRLVVISAAFADRNATVPLWFKAASTPLRRIFRQMAEMERVLRVAEDIEWTAARPGWLLDRDLTRDYQVSANDLPRGTLRTRRADLADFMLDCAQNRDWVHECPFIARRESDDLESPAALLEELKGG